MSLMPTKSGAKPSFCQILPFRPRPCNRLGPRDRIEASRWAMVAQPQGFTRVLIHDAGGEDPEIGDFLLIYETGRDWASWGVARDERGFVVWRPGTGETIGIYTLLREALEAVLAQPATKPRRAARPARVPRSA